MAKKGRKKNKIPVKARVVAPKDTIKYRCSICDVVEDIPVEVLELFDDMNPENAIIGGHQFECEICEFGIMKTIDRR